MEMRLKKLKEDANFNFKYKKPLIRHLFFWCNKKWWHKLPERIVLYLYREFSLY
jgi:hypothetical protein